MTKNNEGTPLTKEDGVAHNGRNKALSEHERPGEASYLDKVRLAAQQQRYNAKPIQGAPEPKAVPGWVFVWVPIDLPADNIIIRQKNGWVFAEPEDQPELLVFSRLQERLGENDPSIAKHSRGSKVDSLIRYQELILMKISQFDWDVLKYAEGHIAPMELEKLARSEMAPRQVSESVNFYDPSSSDLANVRYSRTL